MTEASEMLPIQDTTILHDSKKRTDNKIDWPNRSVKIILIVFWDSRNL